MRTEVKEISFPFSENGSKLLAVRLFRTYDAANAALRVAARSAPSDGSYHKTDFRVTWEDGQVYQGRVDLTRAHSGQDGILEREIRSEIEFYTGRFRPPHVSPEQYLAIIGDFPSDHRKVLEKLSHEYDLGRI